MEENTLIPVLPIGTMKEKTVILRKNNLDL